MTDALRNLSDYELSLSENELLAEEMTYGKRAKKSKQSSKQAAEQFVKDLIEKNKIVVFSKSNCPYSNKVKDLLSSKNIAYKAVELDKES